MSKKTDPHVLAQAQAMADQGLSQKRICQTLGITRCTFYRHIRTLRSSGRISHAPLHPSTGRTLVVEGSEEVLRRMESYCQQYRLAPRWVHEHPLRFYVTVEAAKMRFVKRAGQHYGVTRVEEEADPLVELLHLPMMSTPPTHTHTSTKGGTTDVWHLIASATLPEEESIPRT